MDMLERDQRRLLRLCAALEKIADGLPESLSHTKTAGTLSFLNKAFGRHVFLHEKYLFPLMRSLAAGNASIEPALKQLEYEHSCDHGIVLEIISAFENGTGGGESVNAHMLGFLLRSFFENCRRHHSWEENVLYPVARQHLTGAAVAAHRDTLLRVSLGLKD
jgi:hemerythrin-like domain-containing protein